MTFTIVARDPITRSIGAAVSTASAACGKRVIHHRPGVGLVVTQGKTNVSYGVQGLALLHDGFGPRQALEALTHLDQNREYRQVLMTDLAANWSVFTGDRTELWRGQLITSEFVVMGNTLAGSDVLDAMAAAFQDSSGNLASRMMNALLSGDRAGGDREGKRSAALFVSSPDQFQPYGALLDLRVDFDPEPVTKLADTLRAYCEWEAAQLARIDRRLYYFERE